jgi:hypothetical protein
LAGYTGSIRSARIDVHQMHARSLLRVRARPAVNRSPNPYSTVGVWGTLRPGRAWGKLLALYQAALT